MKAALAVGLGRDVSGETVAIDLAKLAAIAPEGAEATTLEAVALQGQGVLETLRAASDQVTSDLADRLQ